LRFTPKGKLLAKPERYAAITFWLGGSASAMPTENALQFGRFLSVILEKPCSGAKKYTNSSRMDPGHQ
jgi:hypothetical protein